MIVKIFLVLSVCMFLLIIGLISYIVIQRKDYVLFKKQIKYDQTLLMKNEKIIYNEINRIISISKNIENIIHTIHGKINSLDINNDKNTKNIKYKLNDAHKINDSLILELKHLKQKMNDNINKRDI